MFSENGHFIQDNTTMCATHSGESKIAFSDTTSPSLMHLPFERFSNKRGTTAAVETWPPFHGIGKFLLRESSSVMTNEEVILQWDKDMTEWDQSVAFCTYGVAEL